LAGRPSFGPEISIAADCARRESWPAAGTSGRVRAGSLPAGALGGAVEVECELQQQQQWRRRRRRRWRPLGSAALTCLGAGRSTRAAPRLADQSERRAQWSARRPLPAGAGSEQAALKSHD